ncbi:SDR family oxidoreductase [Deinococcus lacus]|uniref:SDR family oxidoreductase n=1 Tax=Deinococcus lacus TaxID=392561 RepID=A0ABW1YA72_9DEIO
MTQPITLITGATGGIGQALARELRPSHQLLLSARPSEQLLALCEELEAEALPLDLSQPDSLEEGIAALGRVTNLIHNAGMAELGPVAEQPAATWQQTLTLNLVAPAELTRLLLPRLRRERGMVVFVNSGAGLRANPGWGSYAASKHGLKALADALREEEAAHGVRVASIYPGRTATAMQRRIREQEGAGYDPSALIQPQTVARSIAHILNTPRDAVLTDISVRPGVG